MQYFNPALLHKRADGYEDAMREVKETEELIQDTQEMVRKRKAQADSRQNDEFQAFDTLSPNYGMSDAVDDISNWWNGEKDKSAAAGNRALTYFTPKLVGSLGLAAVVSLLAGRKGGIMPALIGAVAGWFLGSPVMDFFQKTFGAKPEDVKKRTDDAKKENGTGGDGTKTPAAEKTNEGNNGNNGQQPPQQPQQQPPQQPQQNPPQQPQQNPPQQPTPQPEQPAEDPQEPTDEERLIEEQGGEIPTTGGNPVEDPGAYGLPEEDPASGVPSPPATGQHPQQSEQPQQLTEEEELIREQRQREWEQRQEQELEQLLEETQGEWGQPQQQQPPQPAPTPAPGNNGQPAAGQPKTIPPEPIPPEPIPANPEQPAEDPTAGGAPNMAGQIKGKVEAAAGGMKQAGGKLLDRIRGKLQSTSRPQNPTEARAQMQQPQRPQQPQQPAQQPQQAQRPQMTAEEWQQQVVGRMRIPGMPMKTPEMIFHRYAYNIPEKTTPSYSYLQLGRKPAKEELWEAYPYDMVEEYKNADPLRQFRSHDELSQEMYYNDQRGLMHGRKPQGRPLQTDIPAGKFTLKRNDVYNDLLRQYRRQPKIGPYRQN